MLAALAILAGNALVQAMVTDGWEGIRHKVATLFGRGQPDTRTEQRLDASRKELTAAEPGELERVREGLAGQWQTRFADLLTDHPDAEAELKALIELLTRSAPVASDHAASAGRDMTVRADRGGVAAGVIHGNVSTGRPTQPDAASS